MSDQYKVLIPVEVTYLSKCALELSSQIAKKAGAHIEVVADIETLEENEGFSNTSGEWVRDDSNTVYNGLLTQAVGNRLKEKSNQIKNWTPELEVEPKIIYGMMPDILLEKIERSESDLVMIGGDRFDQGDSELDALIRKSSAPVLTLKCALQKVENYQDIAFLAHKDDSRKLTDHLKQLQDLFEAKLHVVRVNTKESFLTANEAEEWLHEYVKNHHLENYEVVSYDHESEEEGILAYSQQFTHAIVASGVHERRFFDWLFGDHPEGQLIADSIHPVWTFKG